MYLNVYKILLISFIFIMYSCEKDTNSITSYIEEKQILPPSNELHKINIIQSNFDSLLVQSNVDMILESRSISKVFLFKKDSINSSIVDSISPQYSGNYGCYHPIFKFELDVGNETLFYDFTIKYVLFDSSFLEIDTSFTMCKYPHQTSEVYIPYSELTVPLIFMKTAQDLDYYNGKFYFRPFGGYGIYEIDDITGESREVIGYVSHDFIAIDSVFVFYSTDPYTIYYLDFSIGEEIELINLSREPNSECEIMGLEAENGIVYLITLDGFLHKYDYQGNLIESIAYGTYPVYSFSLTKYENKLYSVSNGITVFNLSTNEFEEKLLLPSGDTVAIKISNGYLFYSDYTRAYIGRIPVEDVLSYKN